MDKLDFIQTRVRALLADPIVAAIPTELAAVDSAIRVANLKYWTACPYKYTTTLAIDVFNQGTYIQQIDALTLGAFQNADPIAAKTAYYLGIVRMSDASFGTSIRSFDSWLLGVPLGSSLGDSLGNQNYEYSGTLNPPNLIDYDRLYLDATNFQTMTGRVEYSIDIVQGTIKYLMPSFYGQLTIDHGFGFDDRTMAFIPFNHFDIFTKLVSFEFLDIIIRARSSIELNGDFRINVNDIANRRDGFKEELRRDIPAISQMPIIWG